MTYRVADGTQVLHGGVLHAAGQTFDAEPADVADAVKAGWLEVSKPKGKAGKKVASTGDR